MSRRNRIVSVVVARDQLVDGLDQLVGAEHFGGVQAAVDPDDRLAFLRERVRLIVGQPFGERQTLGDVRGSAPAS